MLSKTEIAETFETLLRDAYREVGAHATADLGSVARYAADRAGLLAQVVGIDGFNEALIAERDNVALRAGIAAVESADALDARILGMAHAVLLFAAKALAAAV